MAYSTLGINYGLLHEAFIRNTGLGRNDFRIKGAYLRDDTGRLQAWPYFDVFVTVPLANVPASGLMEFMGIYRTLQNPDCICLIAAPDDEIIIEK